MLTMGGQSYSGSSGVRRRQRGAYPGNITWSFDSSAQYSGWRICKSPPPWTIAGNGCVMIGDRISSNGVNGVVEYGNDEWCTIDIADDLALTAEEFQTQADHDFLVVGGSKYSGAS